MVRIKRKKITGIRAAAMFMTAMMIASTASGNIYVNAAEAVEVNESVNEPGAEEQTEAESAEKTEEEKNKSESGDEGATTGMTQPAATEEPIEDPEAGNDEYTHPEASVQEALDNEMTMVADDDILLIRIGYEFEDGSFDEWTRGTGFIVGPRYILTRQSLIDSGAESPLLSRITKERGEAYQRVGVNLQSLEETVKHIRFYVSDRFGNDIEIADSSMKSGLGLVVTKKVIDTPACVFADINKISLQEGTEVHAKTAGMTGNSFTVKTFDGTVFIDEKQSAGFAFVMDTEGGAPIGAPVYDNEGHVIGLIAGEAQDKTSYSAKALEAFLSMNGVEYRSIDQIKAESDAQQEEQAREDMLSAELDAVDKTALEDAISRASEINTEEFTDESVTILDESLKKAKDVAIKEDATQEETDAAESDLEAAIENLKKKGFTFSLPQLLTGKISTIVSVILAFIILGVLVLLKKKKILPAAVLKKRSGKSKKEEESNIELVTEEDDLLYAADNGFDLTYREKGKGSSIPKAKGSSNLPYAEKGDEAEATNLEEDDGSADTTVLTERAYIVRTDTGKKIPINKKEFKIGKQKSEVDYCVSGDPTVSRTHCRITYDKGKYYLEDLKSSNFTYYEDEQLPEYNPILLEDGKKFRLADNVEFEFHAGK